MLKELPVLRERGTCCALPVPVDLAWASRQAELLKALADPTRLTMIAALRSAAEPVCICNFTAALSLSQPTMSHHMAKLRGRPRRVRKARHLGLLPAHRRPARQGGHAA